MPKLEAVIFDVYDTLLQIETDEERPDSYRFLSRWLRYHGVTVGPEEFRQRYLELCRQELGRNPEPYPDIDIAEVFSRIADASGEAHGVDVSELALLFRMLTTDRLAAVPGMPELLRELQGRVRLGIASNSQRLFTIPELESFGLCAPFDAILFSSDVLACKPNPKIFESVLRALAVAPEHALFVGDNPFADVYGAKRAGMRALWLDRGKTSSLPQRLAATAPDFAARDLPSLREQLFSLIGGGV